MIIHGKPIYVYDLEVFPNVFSCTLFDTENNKYIVYEVSNRKNEIADIISLFSNNGIMFCGYNNHHYDDAIINFILMYKQPMVVKPYSDVCRNIYTLSDIIVKSGEDTKQWKQFKYAHLFKSFDLLTMLFSSKLRVGLKEMQVTMKFHNVQEYEGDFNLPLPDSEIDTMLAYNKNDVESTNELLNLCQKNIDLRLGIEEEFGIEMPQNDLENIETVGDVIKLLKIFIFFKCHFSGELILSMS